MGGKSAPTNNSVVDEQKAEAAQAAQQEADRQARITKGLASIKTAFEGTPVTTPTTSNFDWSTFAPPQTNALMAQWEAQNPTDPNAGMSTTTGGNVPAGYTAVQSGKGWGLKDASGKITNQGDPLSITTQTPTGATTGGFDQPFYDKYKQSVLDYYMPQVQDQYKDAKDELTYRLQRAGTERSSAANTEVAKLAKQNALNEAGVYNQADTAAGDLRTQVAGEESKATSQLYATEDPDVAANQATDAVRNISLEQPSLSPLSSLFNLATVGSANVLKGYQSNQALSALNAPLPTKTGASRVVGS
jgi:hypothetical protein